MSKRVVVCNVKCGGSNLRGMWVVTATGTEGMVVTHIRDNYWLISLQRGWVILHRSEFTLADPVAAVTLGNDAHTYPSREPQVHQKKR